VLVLVLVLLLELGHVDIIVWLQLDHLHVHCRVSCIKKSRT
jgi:hypothetical protein